MRLTTRFANWISRRASRQTPGHQRQRGSPKRTRTKPLFERLEERTVLSSWAFGLADDTNYTNPVTVQVDAADNMYVAGYFDNTLDFDPGSGTANLTSAGSNDVFLAKYHPDGSLEWARSFGS